MFRSCAALLAAAVTAVSCAPASYSRPLRVHAAESCQPKRAVLVVRNESGYDVDIMQHQRRTGATHLLALVRPGRHELNIPTDIPYTYTARRGGANVSNPPIPSQNPVTLDIECRDG
jgi:hypothetical protein